MSEQTEHNKAKSDGEETIPPVKRADRRTFLKLGALAAGFSVTGAGLFSACSKDDEAVPSGEKARADEGMVKVLTTDGKLVEVKKSSCCKSDSPAGEHCESIGVSDEEARIGIPGKKFIMVIDLAKCEGCGACTEACQQTHFTPPEREWIKVFKMKDAESTVPYWFPKPCFHCDNPPCTKVCPVGATFKRQDGIVLIDNERCIGCRFCMAACPYSTRYFNWYAPPQVAGLENVKYSPEQSYPRKIGTVEKCDFCPHMIRNGKLPCCVTACTKDAIYFGDENENAVTNGSGETVRLSELLRDRAGFRELEELGTKPRVYYLSVKNRRFPEPTPKEIEEAERSAKRKEQS